MGKKYQKLVTVSEKTALVVVPKENLVQLPNLMWLYSQGDDVLRELFPSAQLFADYVRKFAEQRSLLELAGFVERIMDYIDPDYSTETEQEVMEDLDYQFYASAIAKNPDDFLKGDF